VRVLQLQLPALWSSPSQTWATRWVVRSRPKPDQSPNGSAGAAFRCGRLSLEDRARQEFLDNWLAHVKRLGWTNVLVGAIDDSIQAHCEAAGLPSLAMNSTSSLSAELGVEVCEVQ
jgi:hypothetical protein